MKFPKLKHTVLCQVLLYLPAFSLFLGMIPVALIPDGSWLMPVVGIGGPLLGGVFSLWYLICNFALLMCSDIVFSEIRQWKIDREEYRTDRNGRSREEIQKTLLQRCARWGKRYEAKKSGSVPMEVYYRHKYSWTVFYSAIEEQVAVYSTDILSVEQYRWAADQVRSVIHHVPKGKLWLKPKSERKAPQAEVCVILFLADRVEDEVKKLARKPIIEKDEFCIRPCVVQCSNGNYYTKCTAEYYEPGIMPRPAINYAAAMIRRLVFARRVPKENRVTQPVFDSEFNLEMSLWEYIRFFRREMRGAEDELARERAKALYHMRDGEVRIGDGVVWYKREDKLAEYAFLPGEEDERLVMVADDSIWYYQKHDGFMFRLMFGSSLNRRKMKKNEKKQVKQIVEAALIAEGYQIETD